MGGPEIRGVFIFNGGLFPDGHSHPWFTTPLLRRIPNLPVVPWALLHSFKVLVGVIWSKGYHVTDAEVRELYSVLNRRDGLFFLAAAAGFVEDHKRKVIGSTSATY